MAVDAHTDCSYVPNVWFRAVSGQVQEHLEHCNVPNVPVHVLNVPVHVPNVPVHGPNVPQMFPLMSQTGAEGNIWNITGGVTSRRRVHLEHSNVPNVSKRLFRVKKTDA